MTTPVATAPDPGSPPIAGSRRLSLIDNPAGPITCPFCKRVTHRGDDKQGANALMLHHLASRHPDTDVCEWPVFEWSSCG